MHRIPKFMISCGHGVYMAERVHEEVNYDEIANQLVDASPLEVMDRALAMFGSDIAIAFRYVCGP